MKKLLAILPLALAGCTQPQPTAPTKTIGTPNPAAVYCQAIRRHPCRCKRRRASAPVQTTQRRNPDEWALWRRDHPAKSTGRAASRGQHPA